MLLDPVFLLPIPHLEPQSPGEVNQTPSWSPWCREDAAGILRPVVGVHLALELIFHSLHTREKDTETHYPGPALARLSSCSWGSLEPRQGGHQGGEEAGLSIRMSVAVLACWRPISQMIFATIKKCGGVKWRFHIQQGKGGFTWGWVATAGVGEKLSCSAGPPG